MPQPSEESWKKIADDFWSMWQFPASEHLTGRTSKYKLPKVADRFSSIIKKTFSVVLLALVDANYKFIAVDVGAYGKASDGGIFSKSKLGKALEENTLNVPSQDHCLNQVKFCPS